MKLSTGALLVACVLSFCFGAFGQEVPVAVPTYWDGILSFLNSNSVIIGLGFVIELALRFIPTAKAKSLLIPVKYFIDGFVVVLGWLSKNVLDPVITGLNRTK